MLHITMESFVEAQQYVFDGLWTAAVPFKDKLMEIEEPYKRQFAERIAEAIETQRLIKKIIIPRQKKFFSYFQQQIRSCVQNMMVY